MVLGMKGSVCPMKKTKLLLLFILSYTCASCCTNSDEIEANLEDRIYMIVLEEKNQYSLLLEIESFSSISNNIQIGKLGIQTPLLSPNIWVENFSVSNVFAPLESKMSLMKTDKTLSLYDRDELHYKLKISVLSGDEVLVKGLLQNSFTIIPINQKTKIYKRVLIHSSNSVSGINNDK